MQASVGAECGVGMQYEVQCGGAVWRGGVRCGYAAPFYLKLSASRACTIEEKSYFTVGLKDY